METAINWLIDITYLSELIPTPIGINAKLNTQLVWGLNSQTLIDKLNDERYDLCRTSCSISHLLI